MASTQLKNSLLVLGFFIGIGGATLLYVWQTPPDAPAAPAAPVPPPGAPQLHVMFVGNSYTFVNDLPGMLHAVAATDAVSPMDIETGEAVRGGARLAETYADPTAQTTLATGHWDNVVLQEESLMTTRPELAAVAAQGFAEWAVAVRAVGSVPVMFETWARQSGSVDYSNDTATTYSLTNATNMQAGIDSVLGRIAADNGLPIVPVGDVWQVCAAMPGVPDLYMGDGSHPSVAGTYLTALLLYHALTGHSAANSSYVPDGLSAADTSRLAACVGP